MVEIFTHHAWNYASFGRPLQIILNGGHKAYMGELQITLAQLA